MKEHRFFPGGKQRNKCVPLPLLPVAIYGRCSSSNWHRSVNAIKYTGPLQKIQLVLHVSWFIHKVSRCKPGSEGGLPPLQMSSTNALVMVLKKRSRASTSLVWQKQLGLLMGNDRLSPKAGPRHVFLHEGSRGLRLDQVLQNCEQMRNVIIQWVSSTVKHSNREDEASPESRVRSAVHGEGLD